MLSNYIVFIEFDLSSFCSIQLLLSSSLDLYFPKKGDEEKKRRRTIIFILTLISLPSPTFSFSMHTHTPIHIYMYVCRCCSDESMHSRFFYAFFFAYNMSTHESVDIRFSSHFFMLTNG